MGVFETLIPYEEIEEEAQNQIMRNLYHPFMKKLVIMPDCHAGYTLPIGGVALLDNVVSPAYVGFDIGCGMLNITLPSRVKLTENDKWDLYNEIINKIPIGFNSHSKPVADYNFKSAIGDKKLEEQVNSKLNTQMGTLGGGNHFIELGRDSNGNISITIHSGSRKPGWLVGNYYMKLSKEVDKDLPKEFLHLNSKYGSCYIIDMEYMLNYALKNRKYMMKEILKNIIGFSDYTIQDIFDHTLINENHNHAILRHDEVLHRKGATPAKLGQYGVIPGNMRDGVYITLGLGNEKYLFSASHGAGRKMSRKKAKAECSYEKMVEYMNGKVANVSESILDESPDAYKDINTIIKRQEGVVIQVLDKITSEINIKA